MKGRNVPESGGAAPTLILSPTPFWAIEVQALSYLPDSNHLDHFYF